MTLDEAIIHAKEVAEKHGCTACGLDHAQLAAWLEELQDRRRVEEMSLRALKGTKEGAMRL